MSVLFFHLPRLRYAPFKTTIMYRFTISHICTTWPTQLHHLNNICWDAQGLKLLSPVFSSPFPSQTPSNYALRISQSNFTQKKVYQIFAKNVLIYKCPAWTYHAQASGELDQALRHSSNKIVICYIHVIRTSADMSPCNMPCRYRTGGGALYPSFSGARWGWAVNATPRPFYPPPGEETQYPFSTNRLQTLKKWAEERPWTCNGRSA
jgi:hypothetical protein